MSYQHEHIPFLEPIDGYNKIASIFKTYHPKLNQRDQAVMKKYLPRSLSWTKVLDLGGWDGRWAIWLQGSWFASRTIVDGAKLLLENAPSWTEKVCADLRRPLPIASATYWLILSSFVLLHLDGLTMFWAEARRCITAEWRMLIFHHHERRPFVHHLPDWPMKIKSRHRRKEDLIDELSATGREVDLFEVDSWAWIFCCFPK